nr:MAG TPA: hypothetical protein [Caudoviricetes sp.]
MWFDSCVLFGIVILSDYKTNDLCVQVLIVTHLLFLKCVFCLVYVYYNTLNTQNQ